MAWLGLAINVCSGIALFASQATLFIHSLPFLIKITMIVTAAGSTAATACLLGRQASSWELAGTPSGMARGIAVMSLLALLGAIVAGRLIAYF
jgi:hypothetical protein